MATKNVLLKNITFLLFSQVATWVISLILLIVAPERFGAEGFGRVQLAIAYVGFFSLVGSLGSYQYLVKRVARNPEDLGGIVISALKLKALLGVALTTIAIALAFPLGYNREEITLIAIACGGMLISLLNEMVVAGLAGLERMGRTAFWQTVQVYVGSILGLIVLFTSQSTIAFVAAFSVSWFVPLIANFRLIRPFLRDSPPAESGTWKAIVAGGIPVFVLTVFNMTYSTINVPLVNFISGSEVVGWYALAYRWISMPIFITTVVVTAFLPQLSTLAQQSGDGFADLRNKAVRLILLVNIPAAVGLALVADDLIELLYGSSFHESIQLMRLLAPFVPLVGLNTVLATALVASDRHKRYLWVAGTAAVLHPPMALALIAYADRHWASGATGAAIITVVTEVFVTVCALHMRRRGASDRPTLIFAFKCTIAAAAMAPPVILFDRFGLVPSVIAGGLAYALLSLLLGTLSPSSVREGIQELIDARTRSATVGDAGDGDVGDADVAENV